jgi:hypothetical protein
VKLTVHRAVEEHVFGLAGDEILSSESDEYYIRITNASRDRDIVVTQVWIESDPPVPVEDTDLPVRLQYSDPWETSVPVEDVPAAPEEVFWARRLLGEPWWRRALLDAFALSVLGHQLHQGVVRVSGRHLGHG